MEIASLIILLVLMVTAWSLAAGWRKGTPARFLARARREASYLAVFILATGTRMVVERGIRGLQPPLASPDEFRAFGDIAIAAQSIVPLDLGVSFFGATYVLLFIMVILLVPLWLLMHDIAGFRRCCLAISLASVTLMLAHSLVLSPRPGLDPGSGILPVLYEDPFWGPLSGDLISRGQSLPSGHITVLTVVMACVWGSPRARCASIAILFATIGAVIYLGLHWPIDVAVGLVLGYMCSVAAASFVGSMKGERGSGDG